MPACTCCINCNNKGKMHLLSKQAAVSAAPGFGTVTPVRDATLRAWNTRISLVTNCNRNEIGQNAIHHKQKYSAMQTMWPIDINFENIFNLTLAWSRPLMTKIVTFGTLLPMIIKSVLPLTSLLLRVACLALINRRLRA